MPFNTFSVATAVTPSVLETYFAHYLNRSPLRGKPTAHISYHEGLRLIRQFLDYSSRHTVEDLQAFTAQWLPAPSWVRIYDLEVAPQFLDRAAAVLQVHLGRRGLEKVGGKTWWQWRRPEALLRAEWIEMKKDFNERKKTGEKCDRCILYVHGGAYYFGSVDEHRYQMQRHARKMNARVLAPRYRLAPQYPFPCGLQDCIATYLYLLQHFRPEQILFAGDSAGGGMVLSLLVILRDQGLPLPAGTILLSPWCDLTHSFPSVAGDGTGDYIPPHGFHHKPSMAWPPAPTDEAKKRAKKVEQVPSNAVELPAIEVDEGDTNSKASIKRTPIQALPGIGDNLSIMLDGKKVDIKEQIQMYTPNDLLSHPLVSPVTQPSLGGLPPMLIQVGGAELLRDEQIYLAHKAANPKAYPPGDAVMREYDPRREYIDRYPPTDVQLQVWEDLCHVPHTLSFTRPAKYMYRSVAQFGAWALSRAQHQGVEIRDQDDAVSIISSGPEDEGESMNASTTDLRLKKTSASLDIDAGAGSLGKLSLGAVGRAGDLLPAFKDHMIRQRVTRHGVIYNLAPQSEIACLALDPASIGAIKPGPVRKWLAKKREAETKFGNDAKKLAKKRAKEAAAGYDEIPGEDPPPSALVGRRRKGVAPEEKKKQKNWGLAMWSGWGSSHDESTLKREEKAEKDAEMKQHSAESEKKPPGTAQSGNGTLDDQAKRKRRTSSVSMLTAGWSQKQVVDAQQPRSPYRQAVDSGQARPAGESSPRLDSTMRAPYSRDLSASNAPFAPRPVSMAVPTAGQTQPESVPVPGSQNTYLHPQRNRPHDGINAYPFKMRKPASNPSMTTLDSRTPSNLSSHGESFAVAPVEMPTHEDNHVELPTQADEHIEMPTPADERVRTTRSVSPVEDSPRATSSQQRIGRSVPPNHATSNNTPRMSSRTIPNGDPVSATSPTDTAPRGRSPASPVYASASTAPRSGTPLRGSSREEPISALSRSSTSQRAFDEPISAISRSGTLERRFFDEPVSAISRSSTPQSEKNLNSPVDTTSQIPAPFKGRSAIFDNRSSVLGALGPDGMPITPQQARQNGGEKFSARAKTPASVTIPEFTTATTTTIQQQAVNPEELTPITPVDEQKAALDRIRNITSDPSSTQTSSSAPEADNSADSSSLEGDRTMPFRLRKPAAEPRAAAGSEKDSDSTPVTPVDGDKPAPFKIRNPVFDARAATPTPVQQQEDVEKPSPEQAQPPQQNAGEATEATKAAPFKLRHTVYDPSAGFGTAATSSSRANDAPIPALPSDEQPNHELTEPSEAQNIADRAMTPIENCAPEALPPNTNVVMPTVVARRPVVKPANAPPTPPPKDDARKTSPVSNSGLYRKRSKELLSMSLGRDRDRDRDRDRKTPSPVPGVTAATAPKSKFSSNTAATAPTLGDLTFERTGFDDLGGGEKRGGEDEGRRPGLETFVTARDGLGRESGS